MDVKVELRRNDRDIGKRPEREREREREKELFPLLCQLSSSEVGLEAACRKAGKN